MMDNAQLAKASLNDIVFEGRNKAYGAFDIRRAYGRNVTRALIIGAAFLVMLVAIPAIAKYLEERKPKEVLNLQENVLMDAPPLDNAAPPPPPPPPPEAPPPPPPKLNTVKFTPPVVKKDNEVQRTEEVPDQDELKDKAVSTVTVKGNTAAPPPDLSDLSGEGKAPVAEVLEDKVYTYVEQMPQLPGGGGQQAIVNAIQKAFRYPAVDLRNQIEGRVFAKFTVDENGNLTDVETVKGLSSTIDAETIRAIKTLPKFIPGKQNGRAVKVSFTVPISLKIQ